MRILLSCLQSEHRYQVPAYQYWSEYFKRGIEEGGHEWVEVPDADWAKGLTFRTQHDSAAWRAETWGRTVEFARAEHAARGIDMFLGYLYPPMVDDGAVRTMRSLGIPCVNYFCDNVREFRRIPDEYAPFDLHWVPELAASAMYARAGMPHVVAAMPTWVDPRHRTHEHDEAYPATFIGSRDAQREVLFADVLARGGRVELRGAGWPLPGAAPTASAGVASAAPKRQPLPAMLASQADLVRRLGPAALARKIRERFRAPVSDDVFRAHVRARPDQAGYVEITQRSSVTLGVNRYPSLLYPFERPDTYSRGRDVEAPMLGACYLTEYTPQLEEMYELGVELETYVTAEEMVAKIDMLTRDPARRRRLRRAGQARALSEHSVPRSIARIGEKLGLLAAR